MSTAYDLIKQAILERKQVTAVYNGRYRELCPHQLGTNKEGRYQCLFYQFGGDSSGGPIVDGDPGNWRCLPLDGLVDVHLRDGEWHSAANYVNPGTCLEEILIKIEP